MKGSLQAELLASAHETRVLGGRRAGAKIKKEVDGGPKPSRGQAKGGVGAAQRADWGRRGGGRDRALWGRGRDGRSRTAGRKARRRALRLHLGRRARVQGGQLLPRALLGRPTRRRSGRARTRGGGGQLASPRGGAVPARVQGRARDGRQGAS